ncbi:hypothetical protein MGMO_52c00140 [Methyloglobulus morosus KoM1]|uniref:Uncharacterized protein n=1 Tax=Methyloglobulus morosus KoM1 TaxID=1116472 RepID=V5BH82_9GAMM|nr:hypothetical protein MGMO_52c00140 [Methyloglobulus morosus KoM1]
MNLKKAIEPRTNPFAAREATGSANLNTAGQKRKKI